MYKTEDNIIDITVAKNPGDMVYQPADWSIFNIPANEQEVLNLAARLDDMPTSRHVCLLLCRHQRRYRLSALANISLMRPKFTFLDLINITYDKPSTCSNNGFLPISEPGCLLFNGTAPDAKCTSWFSNAYQNATNHWNVHSQLIENDLFKNTYCHKFSWELQLLMYSLVGVKEYNRFIYGLPLTDIEIRSLHSFCKKYNLSVEILTQSDAQAEKLITACGVITEKEL